ncbi:TetR/AcrR family transcriptional regulator [Mariniluteicoccus flavus]
MPTAPTASRRRDAERTTADLLDAAEHEFAEHGFAGARVDRLAARAGCNKALIFQRFGDKEGIYTAVFAAVQQRWTPTDDELRALLNADTRDAFVASIERIVDWTIRFLVAEPRAARIMLWEVASGWAILGHPDSPEHQAHQAHRHATNQGPQLAPIREFLDAADRSGWLRPDLTSEVQLSLVTQIPMVLSAMRFDIAEPSFKAFVTDFIVAGLVVPAN